MTYKWIKYSGGTMEVDITDKIKQIIRTESEVC